MPVITYPPQDILYPDQWSLKTMKIPQAWELLRNISEEKTYGDPDIIIGILDQGILSGTVNGELVCTHADLSGHVSNGKNKIARFYDFSNNTVEENNNTVTIGHGMSAASVAAAKVDHGLQNGMVGVAPACRLMAGKRSEDTGDTIMASSLARMAGFIQSAKGYMYVPTGGCDIINCSFNWLYNGESHEPAALTKQVSFSMARQGRHGKGTVLIIATGNNAEAVSIKNLLPKYTDCIVVGASVIDATNKETFAPYSNYSDDFATVDICAPSSLATGEELENNPVMNKGIIAATLPGQGNILHNNHINYFGGTSAAAPMVAGVVALMLTANPDLTAAEVKQILRDTADIIDRNTTDEMAKWISIPNPIPNQRPILYSKKMGFGRVNAEKAVQKAIDML